MSQAFNSAAVLSGRGSLSPAHTWTYSTRRPTQTGGHGVAHPAGRNAQRLTLSKLCPPVRPSDRTVSRHEAMEHAKLQVQEMWQIQQTHDQLQVRTAPQLLFRTWSGWNFRSQLLYWGPQQPHHAGEHYGAASAWCLKAEGNPEIEGVDV